jgi:hypothetical protein
VSNPPREPPAPLLAAEINALPERVRYYIHDLETRADPSGDVQTIASLTEQRDALVLVRADLAAQVRSLRGNADTIATVTTTLDAAGIPAAKSDGSVLSVEERVEDMALRLATAESALRTAREEVAALNGASARTKTPVERFFEGDMECEEHAGVAWPHDDCAGPGMPWTAPRVGDPVTVHNVTRLPVGAVVEWQFNDRTWTAEKHGPNDWVEQHTGADFDDAAIVNDPPAVVKALPSAADPHTADEDDGAPDPAGEVGGER